MIDQEDPHLRLQALLILGKSREPLSKVTLQRLLRDEREDIRRMTLIHIGTHPREDVYAEVNRALRGGAITPALVDTYLATLRQLQPAFVATWGWTR